MRSKGYSIFIVPRDSAYENAGAIIRDLATRFEGPVFEPHVSILPQVIATAAEVIEKTEHILENVKPFSIVTSTLHFGATYFTSLYLGVEPTAELTGLSQAAREQFKRLDDPPYAPHMSLFYGELEQGLRTTMAEQIGSPQLGFRVERIGVFDVDNKTAAEWKCIQEIGLSSA